MGTGIGATMAVAAAEVAGKTAYDAKRSARGAVAGARARACEARRRHSREGGTDVALGGCLRRSVSVSAIVRHRRCGIGTRSATRALLVPWEQSAGSVRTSSRSNCSHEPFQCVKTFLALMGALPLERLQTFGARACLGGGCVQRISSHPGCTEWTLTADAASSSKAVGDRAVVTVVCDGESTIESACRAGCARRICEREEEATASVRSAQESSRTRASTAKRMRPRPTMSIRKGIKGIERLPDFLGFAGSGSTEMGILASIASSSSSSSSSQTSTAASMVEKCGS